MGMGFRHVKVIIFAMVIVACIEGTQHHLQLQSQQQHQHRTKAASEKQHDLWCYRCDTMVDGERCLDLARNSSHMHAKCHKEQKKCQVRRISMSTSTDEITGTPKLWLLQRNCSETCEPGCIVIGERTKLHSCITCCDEQNYCNAGSGSRQIRFALGELLETLSRYVGSIWCSRYTEMQAIR